MRLVVGLGNPGAEYAETRHNVGFRVVAALAEGLRLELRAGRGDFVTGLGALAGEDVRLLLPLTYMNESGRAVRQAVDQWSLEPPDVLVVCDDVHLPLGHIRLRRAGGPGGHNGLTSIIESIGSERFARLRVGIGASPDGKDQADYVLEPFDECELGIARQMIKDAAGAVRVVVRDGLDAGMNRINRKASAEGEDA